MQGSTDKSREGKTYCHSCAAPTRQDLSAAGYLLASAGNAHVHLDGTAHVLTGAGEGNRRILLDEDIIRIFTAKHTGVSQPKTEKRLICLIVIARLSVILPMLRLRKSFALAKPASFQDLNLQCKNTFLK